MRVFVVVNSVAEIGGRQTTALLIAGLVNRGHDVWLVDVSAVSISGGRADTGVQATGVWLGQQENMRNLDSDNVEERCRGVSASDFQSVRLNANDLILIRTNPGRDAGSAAIHETFLYLCQIAQLRGIRVLNCPVNLALFASKAAILMLEPRFRPATIVSPNAEEVVGFIRDSDQHCVVKPLVGSRGQDVIRVAADQPGLAELIRNTFGSRPVVAQHFVNSVEPGDKRVVVVNGELLELNGHYGGIHRLPAEGDFRANLHAGGTARPLTLEAKEIEAVQHAARLLNRHGIALAGVDLVGDQVIELNVFSTGGIYDANRFAGEDFASEIIDRMDIGDR